MSPGGAHANFCTQAAAYGLLEQKHDFGDIAAFLYELTPIADIVDCAKLTLSGCGWLALGMLPGSKILKGVGNIADGAKAGAKAADNLGDPGKALDDIIACARSFTGETRVLMADGTTKPVSHITIGDQVIAADPDTGDQGPRTVTAVWIHQDTVLDLTLDDGTSDGATISTTEDHPFYNITDQAWQRADQLNPGDQLHTHDDTEVRVGGLDPGTKRITTAYNLTTEDLHTYHVLVGAAPVLVHNDGPFCGVPFGKNTPGEADFHNSDYSLDEMTEFIYGHTDAGNPTRNRPSRAEIEMTLRNAGPVKIPGQNAARLEYGNVRVIVNYDMPYRSTAYYPGR